MKYTCDHKNLIMPKIGTLKHIIRAHKRGSLGIKLTNPIIQTSHHFIRKQECPQREICTHPNKGSYYQIIKVQP